MGSTPLLLLQWLDADEYKETKAVLAKYANDINVYYADVNSKKDAVKAIARLFLLDWDFRIEPPCNERECLGGVSLEGFS